jgi:shikimate kinase
MANEIKQDEVGGHMKKLYLLIGPKGAGKTHLGELIAANTSIDFIHVEAIWLDYFRSKRNDIRGWQLVIQEIENRFRNRNRVMIESLGVGEPFAETVAYFKDKAELYYINVWAELGTCMQRIKNRDASRQIPVEEEKIREYNEKVAAANHDWDLVIDNNGPASAGEILAQIGMIE